MGDSLKHLRLILAQLLFGVRHSTLGDYVSASEPIVVSNPDLDDWASRTIQRLTTVGSDTNTGASGHVGAGAPLERLLDFLVATELTEELTATATWWASAEGVGTWWLTSSTRQRRGALAAVTWQLKRAQAVGEAERAGEQASWFWEAARDLTVALQDAAKRF